MRTHVAIAAAVLALACHEQEVPAASDRHAAAPAVPAVPAPGLPQPKVGSAAFHLALAGVHERFQDPKVAGEHFAQALKAAESPAQRVEAYWGLGRVKEACQDGTGAIDALEHALAELDAPPAAGAAPGGLAEAPARDDAVARLARLYAEVGRIDDAERLYASRLAAVRDPWQRELIYRREVELYRAAGRLDAKIAERESALAKSPQDEPALRFLAAAFAAEGMPAIALAPETKPQLTRAVRVHEQLHRLHPDDLHVRQTLQALLERAGRTDEAVKLAVAPPAAAPQAAAACVPGAAVPMPSPALAGAVEAVRIRIRARDAASARAETAKVAARATRDGVAASLIAAELYLEQGDGARADQVIRDAARRARSADDQRQVALAREQVLVRFGRGEELADLHAAWRRSSDPCLRAAAARSDEQRLVMAAPAGPTAPSPARAPRGR